MRATVSGSRLHSFAASGRDALERARHLLPARLLVLLLVLLVLR